MPKIVESAFDPAALRAFFHAVFHLPIGCIGSGA
jgi:hypothetical protein